VPVLGRQTADLDILSLYYSEDHYVGGSLSLNELLLERTVPEEAAHRLHWGSHTICSKSYAKPACGLFIVPGGMDFGERLTGTLRTRTVRTADCS